MLKLLKTTAIADAQFVSAAVPEADHPAYSAGTTYPAGALVMHAHSRWESLQSSNVGHTPGDAASSTWWLRLGPTNLWAAFDGKAATPTVLTTSTGTPALWLRTAPGVCNGVYVQGIVGAASVRCQMHNGATQVFDQTQTLDGSLVANWYDYWFAPFDVLTDVSFEGLPPYHGGQITITVTPPAVGGTVKVANVLYGSWVELGNVEYGIGADFKDYSVKSENKDFGGYDLVQRDYTSVPSYPLVVEKKHFRRVWSTLAAMRATPTIFRATGDVELTPLNGFGFIDSFSVVMRYHDYIHLNLKAQGLT